MSVQTETPAPALTLVPEQPQDGAAIEALLDHAFGPGRFTKCSERVREFADFAPELSFCAFEGGRLVGVVRQWRVKVGETPVVFLGPLAVAAEHRSAGLGGLLVKKACQAALAAGEHAVLLVGDAPYFAKFGFGPQAAAEVVMPGPVDQSRVQAVVFGEAVELSGAVTAR